MALVPLSCKMSWYIAGCSLNVSFTAVALLCFSIFVSPSFTIAIKVYLTSFGIFSSISYIRFILQKSKSAVRFLIVFSRLMELLCRLWTLSRILFIAVERHSSRLSIEGHKLLFLFTTFIAPVSIIARVSI